MRVTKAAKNSFHDESTIRHLKFLDKPANDQIISCLSKNEGYYGIARDQECVGKIYLTGQEVLSVNAGVISPEVKVLAEKLVPEGEYIIEANELYEQDYDNLQEVYIFKKVKRETDFPYGVYTLMSHQKLGIVFKKHFISDDIKNKVMVENKDLVSKIKDFFTQGREGRANRIGMLLYGPPGNGKTSEIYRLITVCELLKIRVVLMDSGFPLRALNAFREPLQGQNMVFVFEEMTERIQRASMEEILTFLDGENSWNNAVNIATTNYPEDFPANLVDRPGRFEEFILFDNPSNEQVIELGVKFGFSEEDSKGLTGLNLSFDYASYLFSLAKRTNVPPNVAKQQEEAKRARLSSTFKGKMGF